MFAAQPALHNPYALVVNTHKDAPANQIYLHQQRTVEVIQLIEVPPPPPRSHPYSSTLPSSSFVSSSYDSDDDSEEDESICSSYCSSEEDAAADQAPAYDDTYKTRLTRVLAWREGFAKPFGEHDSLLAPPSSPVSSAPSSSARKRKADSDVGYHSDSDMSSRSSKRSRSIPPPERIQWKERRLSAHSCPACDAGFSSLQGLREHAQQSVDACREAVEYGLEP